MRQPYKEKFLSDVDGDGYPIPNHLPFAVLNIGKLPDVKVAQGLLADARCLNCPPTEQCSRSGYCEQRDPSFDYKLGLPKANPQGWREVDGVYLPPITWALQEAKTEQDLREVVNAAQTNALANISTDGITILSDAEAHEAFFGWKK